MSASTPPSLKPVLFPQPLAGKRRRWLMLLPLAGLAMAAWWPVARGAAHDELPDTEPAMNAAPPPARAPGESQSDALLERGVVAFERVRYDSAAAYLRRALQTQGSDSLDVSQRARALTYLAAAELHRGRRDTSVAVFRRLLQESPRRVPDSLVFSPRVTALYASVRASLHGVARVRSTARGVDLIVIAFTPHRLGVGVRVHDGEPLRELFDAVVSDSVVVSWDGRKDDGTLAPNGAYDFVLIAFGPDGNVAKAVRFPVTLDQRNPAEPPRPRSVDAPLGARLGGL